MMVHPHSTELRDLRARLGLTQSALAALLSERIPGLALRQQHIHRWEVGEYAPHPALMVVLRDLTEQKENPR